MFVELRRSFVRIGRDQEPNFEIGRVWGRKIGGWMEWSELHEHRRIVLLAEASSGKSAEFRNQSDTLYATGHPAFFVTIEELADHGFETALEPDRAQAFERWRVGPSDGWFFLDSLDEARLNRKSFELALKRFVRDLSTSLERARVFISCRVSDWKGAEDRGFIERLLPAWERPKETQAEGSALLDPIFKEKQKSRTKTSRKPERSPNELTVVQLVPLSLDRCRVLAAHLGVEDVEAFIKGVEQSGLEAFAERPGDVIDLADYWISFGRFGTFAQMVEHGIDRKLRERDNFRPDNEILTVQEARVGAERVAAALTLGKSFTLRAPGCDHDPSLAAGALDPGAILSDWTEAKRNALLRRGVFAPATYGRIRFHHRSTQEYLTARWLDRLLRGSGSREEIWNLVFASRYGVDTVVPSLRPAAAWLALWHSDFRNELIAREPLVLVRQGDPGSLPIESRSQLLAAYASKQAAAEISDDSLENRAISMFADRRLANAVREAWARNPRLDFRFELSRIIRGGSIADCADLTRGVALDPQAEDYHRIVAMQALVACKDERGLAAAAQNLVEDVASLSSRLAVESARVLYPNHLTLPQLFTLIEHVRPPKAYSGEGFGYAIAELLEATSDREHRNEFISRVAELCLSKPFVEQYQRISKRHIELAKHIQPVASREVESIGDREPPEHLIRLLMVAERAGRDYAVDREAPSLSDLVRTKPKIQRALLWADVAEQRASARDYNNPTRHWQVMVGETTLWQFGEADLAWLQEDLAARTSEADQRIALSAIFEILARADRLNTELPRLTALIESRPVLERDLADYLAPPSSSAEMQRHEKRMAERQREQDESEAKDKDSWVRLERDLRQNPGQLRDPQKLQSWEAGAWRLWSLTTWLMRRAEVNDGAAPTQWRLLEEGFGREVAEAYRDGLRIHWRTLKPARPKRHKDGRLTTKYPNMLAFGAVGVEAGEDADWTSHLSDHDALQAALHGCLTERGYPEWIEALVASHPRVVLPIIRRALRDEYLSRAPSPSDFVYRYGRGTQPIHPAIQKILFDLIVKNEPRDPNKFNCMLGMVEGIELVPKQTKKLFQIVELRFSEHRLAGRSTEALWSLALLLLLDFNKGLSHLEDWLTNVPPTQVKENAEQTFAFLFDRHNPTIPSVLPKATVADIERLLLLAYAYIRPEADAHHEGSYSPDTRDHAENARNSILGAILDRPGANAYHTLRRVADDPAFALRASRFRELARGKAERDADPPAWTPKEVCVFERERTAPVKTGTDLLRLVESVLQDIQFQLDKGDASSRPLLQRAQDEEEVQNWLVEQMGLRSRERFRAFREAEVAQGDKPDVIVASTSASCEVAIEVKHSKNWTLRKLDDALRTQLAENYLKPQSRRHGLLVITHHLARQWRDTETNELLTFNSLIERLGSTAATLVRNSAGAIEVKCVGLDATDRVIG